jgi:outer membrane scaffolding protein for murein synthesis (MipA/OmpV family)
LSRSPGLYGQRQKCPFVNVQFSRWSKRLEVSQRFTGAGGVPYVATVFRLSIKVSTMRSHTPWENSNDQVVGLGDAVLFDDGLPFFTTKNTKDTKRRWGNR